MSPDGTQIAFVSVRDGNYQVLVADLDGTDRVQVTQGKGDHRRPDWSPDGQWLAYNSGKGASSGLRVIGVALPDGGTGGSGERQLTWGTVDTDAAWSPDGQLIAFVSSDLSRALFAALVPALRVGTRGKREKSVGFALLFDSDAPRWHTVERGAHDKRV